MQKKGINFLLYYYFCSFIYFFSFVFFLFFLLKIKRNLRSRIDELKEILISFNRLSHHHEINVRDQLVRNIVFEKSYQKEKKRREENLENDGSR